MFYNCFFLNISIFYQDDPETMLKSLTVASALLSMIQRKGLSPTLMTLKDELVSFIINIIILILFFVRNYVLLVCSEAPGDHQVTADTRFKLTLDEDFTKSFGQNWGSPLLDKKCINYI